MSTRSAIAKKDEFGNFVSIYCHFDGYPEHNGNILVNFYNTEEKVDELLSHGDASSINSTIEESVFYHRDRGEELSEPEHFHSLTEFINYFSDCEYFYIFEDNKWKCFNRNQRGFII